MVDVIYLDQTHEMVQLLELTRLQEQEDMYPKITKMEIQEQPMEPTHSQVLTPNDPDDKARFQ